MMQWQIPQNNSAEEIDEHDMPTEPISYEAVSPSAPTVSQGANPSYPSYNEVIPAPQPLEQPFPRQYVPFIPAQIAAPPIPGGAYPVFPPSGVASGQKKWTRSGGETPDSEMGLPPKSAHSALTTRRSSAPALVRLFFIAVRLLLLVQFVLTILHSLLHWQDNALWVSVVYILSPVFIWPVRILIQQIPLPFSLWPELYILLAIVFYSILSRILVGLTKWFTRYR
jgi:hypothetical protein